MIIAINSSLDASYRQKFAEHDTVLSEHGRQLQELRDEVDRVKAKDIALEEAQSTLKNEMEAFQRTLSAAESSAVTQRDMEAEDFTREPRLNVLRIGSPKLLSKQAVQQAIEPWLSRLQLPEGSLQLLGPEAGSQFELVFPGEGNLGLKLAANRAKKANSLLRVDGKWEEIHAVTPSEEQVKLSIAPDESAEKRTTRRWAKKIIAVLKERHPAISAFFRPRAGAIFVNGKTALAKISPTSSAFAANEVLWNTTLVQELAIDRAIILADVANQLSPLPGNITWSL